MAFLFNPLQFLVFPFVFLVALPIALCAGFTTILAFLVLFLRLFLVYFDVGLETLRYVLVGNTAHNHYLASRQRILHSRTPSSSSSGSSPISSPALLRSQRRRRRKSSSAGSGTMTPVGGLDGLTLTPSTGLDRDFEGIGGWRLDSVDVNADGGGTGTVDDNQQWYNLNSRLELAYHRHHTRSHSGAMAAPQSPEGLRMTTSPNSSRSRTPTSLRRKGLTKLDDDGGYFPPCEGRHMKKSSA